MGGVWCGVCSVWWVGGGVRGEGVCGGGTDDVI